MLAAARKRLRRYRVSGRFVIRIFGCPQKNPLTRSLLLDHPGKRAGDLGSLVLN